MRRARVMLGWLAVGAVVNVAVAWGCAFWPNTQVESWTSMTNIVETFGVESFGGEVRTIPRVVYRVNDHRALPALASGFQIFSGWHRFGVDRYMLDFRVDSKHTCQTYAIVIGWPMRSLWAHRTTYIREERIPFRSSYEEWESGVLFVVGKNDQWIPYLPYWPGFIINTIVIGGLLWMIFVGRLAMQRTLRVMRGRCPKCAYDLRGAEHAACPECGAAMAGPRTNVDDVPPPPTSPSTGAR